MVVRTGIITPLTNAKNQKKNRITAWIQSLVNDHVSFRCKICQTTIEPMSLSANLVSLDFFGKPWIAYEKMVLCLTSFPWLHFVCKWVTFFSFIKNEIINALLQSIDRDVYSELYRRQESLELANHPTVSIIELSLKAVQVIASKSSFGPFEMFRLVLTFVALWMLLTLCNIIKSIVQWIDRKNTNHHCHRI